MKDLNSEERGIRVVGMTDEDLIFLLNTNQPVENGLYLSQDAQYSEVMKYARTQGIFRSNVSGKVSKPKDPIMPEFDGESHINIYSKGYTAIGRFLSNFHMYTDDKGQRQTIEGHWFKKRAELSGFEWDGYDKDLIERLPYMNGPNAKKYGTALINKVPQRLRDCFNHHKFRLEMCKLIKDKIERNPNYCIQADWPPFVHYYYYGEMHNPKVIHSNNNPWLIWIVNFLAKRRFKSISQTWIGSRDLKQFPESAVEAFKSECELSTNTGWGVYTGDAVGSDFKATQAACRALSSDQWEHGNTELIIVAPYWKNYDDMYHENSEILIPNKDEMDFCRTVLELSGVCMYLDKLPKSTQRLFCRNVMQVTGKNFDEFTYMVNFLDPMTKGGKVKGGTRIAVGLADWCGIKTKNYKDE